MPRKGLDIAAATHLALTIYGEDILSDPRKLQSLFCNEIDRECAELSILETHCTEEILRPYAEQLRLESPDLNLAARGASETLTTVMMLTDQAAQPISNGIAAGIARWAHDYPYSRSVKAAPTTMPIGANEEEYLSLAASTWNAILHCGPEVLLKPRVFSGFLFDHMDPDSIEIRILQYNCNASLLHPFHACTCGTTHIDVATAQAMGYLIDTCLIEPKYATLVAHSMSEGVSLWTGTLPSWLDSEPKTADTTHPNRPPSPDHSRRNTHKNVDTDPSIAGIFLTDDHAVFAATMHHEEERLTTCGEPIGLIPSSKDMAAPEMRKMRAQIAHRLGKDEHEPVDAFVASSDFQLSSAQYLATVLREGGIRVLRWTLPTDAICIARYRDYLPLDNYYLLATYLGATRATAALYDCASSTIECLAIRQCPLESDAESRQAAIIKLVESINHDSGNCLISPQWGRFGLRICILDEKGASPDIETSIKAALGQSSLVMETVPMGFADIARGLAMYANATANEGNGRHPSKPIVLLQRSGLSVCLEGTRRHQLELISAHDTIPINSGTTSLAENKGIGAPTYVLLRRTDGTGLRVPLPKDAKDLCAKWVQVGVTDKVFVPVIEASISMDADRQITLTLRGPDKNQPQGRTVEVCVNDQLGKAVPIAPKQPQTPSPVSKTVMSEQTARNVSFIGLALLALFIVILVITHTLS